jgi:phosphatidylglycerol:prolipoprotein diacylglycerol transferase
LEIPSVHRLPPFNDLGQYPPSTRFHPAFLYESILDLLLCGLLVWAFLRVRDQLKPGDIVIGYVIGYSIIRYFMDFLRTDMTSAQTLALILIGLGVVALIARHWPQRKAQVAA